MGLWKRTREGEGGGSRREPSGGREAEGTQVVFEDRYDLDRRGRSFDLSNEEGRQRQKGRMSRMVPFLPWTVSRFGFDRFGCGGFDGHPMHRGDRSKARSFDPSVPPIVRPRKTPAMGDGTMVRCTRDVALLPSSCLYRVPKLSFPLATSFVFLRSSRWDRTSMRRRSERDEGTTTSERTSSMDGRRGRRCREDPRHAKTSRVRDPTGLRVVRSSVDPLVRGSTDVSPSNERNRARPRTCEPGREGRSKDAVAYRVKDVFYRSFGSFDPSHPSMERDGWIPATRVCSSWDRSRVRTSATKRHQNLHPGAPSVVAMFSLQCAS